MIYEPGIYEPITKIEIDRNERIIQAGEPIFNAITDIPVRYAETPTRLTIVRYAVYEHGVYSAYPVIRASELF